MLDLWQSREVEAALGESKWLKRSLAPFLDNAFVDEIKMPKLISFFVGLYRANRNLDYKEAKPKGLFFFHDDMLRVGTSR